MKQRIAIIGTGIAGMGAAYHLKDHFSITLFEQNNYVGGHTNTLTLAEDDKIVRFDTGFTVFNKVTYPNLCRLFDEIKAPVIESNVSFSVQHCESGLEYCSTGFNGLFAQRKNIFNVEYIKMLMQIDRFNKESIEDLENKQFAGYTLRQYVKEKGYGHEMLYKYLIPMSSAVWSTSANRMLDFPAVTLIRFFKNHGFLGLNTQHQWYTLQNGSHSYRDLLIKSFKENIVINKRVVGIKRQKIYERPEVVLFFEDGSVQKFDKVVFACHSDQALRILEDEATNLEYSLLRNFRYEKNIATVHTDEAVMPTNKKVWSSWNCRVESLGKTSTIYWMNKLQDVSSDVNYFVSLNDPGLINEKKIINLIEYEHPLFDLKAIAAQEQLYKLNQLSEIDGEEKTTFYCGSYFKYGFHEDAYTAGLNCANAIKVCANTAKIAKL
ncbi:NAD(P)/FAD-dependent oxidoreductase [Solitalea canadensis]|uniref:Putative NAD/FAD-binding protein n=1 Tax=Solitalea canadensis (strain ATCC 29591 / DSM 3403 / JCM 21819 / LMG 8368 / NBRC 15130 / NCIMB 12057 / USAM 9D) TaxID=929556 RepID=H8KKY5_SOLCM|nr:FAD-dependent oxidoreductase [Solitalea canadensis]AFD08802.1 putative NAD/FAD-binding protein [Solitalea canadensis DSM 3403]